MYGTVVVFVLLARVPPRACRVVAETAAVNREPAHQRVVSLGGPGPSLAKAWLSVEEVRVGEEVDTEKI